MDLFRLVHKKKLFRRSSVNYRTFRAGPTWSDLLHAEKKVKAALNCPKIVTYTVKSVTFLFHIISGQLWKAMFLMFETETVAPCLVRKLKWERHGSPGPSSGYAPGLWGDWYLIIWLEITVQTFTMDSWSVIFSNCL